MLVLPYIKNISESINLSIDKNEYMTGNRILNKLTRFIKRHKDSNKYDANNNIVYKILCNNYYKQESMNMWKILGLMSLDILSLNIC